MNWRGRLWKKSKNFEWMEEKLFQKNKKPLRFLHTESEGRSWDLQGQRQN
jgi:hypothetical protein